MPHDPGQRLQKALAQLGLGSRREVEAWIRAGRLTVNGETATLGARVRESDRIRLDGRLVRQRPAASQQVFICHRSPGEPLDAASAGEGLFQRLPRAGGRRFIAVSPMPLHDGGLELVTSDGEIAERLQRAVRGLAGEFSVRLRGELPESALASVRSGALDSGRALEVLDCTAGGGEGVNHWYALSVLGASGKDVRQLFERAGAIVSRVLRTRLGTLALDRALSRGRFRRLTPAELHALLGAGDPGDPGETFPAIAAHVPMPRDATSSDRPRPTARRKPRR